MMTDTEPPPTTILSDDQLQAIALWLDQHPDEVPGRLLTIAERRRCLFLRWMRQQEQHQGLGD